MLDFQGIASDSTVDRVARVLGVTHKAAKQVVALIQHVFAALSENLGLDLPKIEPLAFIEIILDKAEGKERPIVMEDLDELFPGLAKIVQDKKLED